MKFGFIALSALLLTSAFPQAPGYAQAPSPGQPYIQVPIPGIPGVGPERREERGYDREHCERLMDSEHDLRDRLAHARSGEERERLEYRIREVHGERARCQAR
jgi:hypothetical protein